MTGPELAELGEDISKHGLQQKIVLLKDKAGKVCLLDGRNRLDAMESVKMTTVASGRLTVPTTMINATADFDPTAYVVSANLKRRHLTVEQKRDLIAKLLTQTPETSDRQIGELALASHTTVGKVRAEMEGRGQLGHVERHADTKGRRQPAHKVPPAGMSAAKATESATVPGAAPTRETKSADAEPLPGKRPSIAQLHCTGCGASTGAACNCGEPYLAPGARITSRDAREILKGLSAETAAKTIIDALGMDNARRIASMIEASTSAANTRTAA